MKRIFLITMVVVSFYGCAITGVTAQSTETPEVTQTPEENNNVIRELNSNVVVRSIEWDFDTETVIVVLDSERAETITFTDALITEDRQTPLNREEYTIDGETRVTFDVNSYNRKMAITIDAGELHPFMESDSLIDFTQSYTWQQILISIAFGGIFGTSVVFGVAYKKEIEISDEIERIT